MSNHSASVKFMLTQADKVELRARGLTDDQIAELTPQQAEGILGEFVEADAAEGFQVKEPAKSNGHDPHSASQAPILRLLAFDTRRDRLSKHFKELEDGSIDADGTTQLYSGVYFVGEYPASDPVFALTAIGQSFDNLKSTQAIALGVPKDGTKQGTVTTRDKLAELKAKIEAAGVDENAISRTKDCIDWPLGPGLFLFDGDDIDGLYALFCELYPPGRDVAMLIRGSVSSSIAEPKTGLPLKKAEHGFVLIDDPQRSKNCLEALLRLAWCKGSGQARGFLKLNAAGAVYKCGPFDNCVGSPERLVYEGAASVGKNVKRLPRSSAVVGGKGILCAEDLIGYADLHAPVERYNELVTEALADPDFIQRRIEIITARRGFYVEREVKRTRKPKAQVEQEFDATLGSVEATCEAARTGSIGIGERQEIVLPLGHELSWPHGGQPFTIEDIVKDPKAYHGKEICDPIEGRSYKSKNPAIIYTDGGQIRIYSRAHNDAFMYSYQMFDMADFSAQLRELLGEAAPPEDDAPGDNNKAFLDKVNEAFPDPHDWWLKVFPNAGWDRHDWCFSPSKSATLNVIEVGGAADEIAAALLLCKRIGVDPKALGYIPPVSVTPGPAPGPSPKPKPKGKIQATPYEWVDPDKIPMRDWLYGRLLIRKFVTATIAPGGLGKSSLVTVETLAQVSGRALLGIEPDECLTVWLINLEDPAEETTRKIQAAAKHYELTRDDIGDRLFTDSGRDQEFVIAKADNNGSPSLVMPVLQSIVAEIIVHKIDVIVIDPFVSSHALPENDNVAQDMVVKAWAAVAEKGNCAVHLIDHTRKLGPDSEVTTESSRGAKAKTDAARVVRTLNRMTADQGATCGVENHRLYFRTYNDKSNLAPPADKSIWHELKNVDLGNGPAVRYGHMALSEGGDKVGVAVSWEWPNPMDGVTGGDFDKAAAAIRGGEWRLNNQAKAWVGHAVAKALGLGDVRKKCPARTKVKGMVDAWLYHGSLVVVERYDERAHKNKEFVELAGSPLRDDAPQQDRNFVEVAEEPSSDDAPQQEEEE